MPKKVSTSKIRLSVVNDAPGDDGLFEQERSILTTKLQIPKGYLSPSQIEMYLRCPQQYKMRYVDGISSPPAVALVEGSSHHEALAENNKTVIRGRGNLKTAEVVDAFVQSFNRRKKEIEDWEGDDENTVVNRGRAMLQAYMKEFAPKFVAVQQEFDVFMQIGPLRVQGITDAKGMVDGDRPSVVDYKTVARSKSQAELESSLQLSFYAGVEAATGDEDFDVGYVNLLKSGKVNPQFVPYEPRRVRWFRAVALSVADAISRGCFPMTSPDSWACSERFCGYWSRCRGRICNA
jgi:hypothetical protein